MEAARSLVERLLQKRCGNRVLILPRSIHGDARGVDQIAGITGNDRGWRVRVFPPKWEVYGKSAGVRRNIEMVEEADAVVAVWDGKSRGTKHTINHAKKVGVPVHVYQHR